MAVYIEVDDEQGEVHVMEDGVCLCHTKGKNAARRIRDALNQIESTKILDEINEITNRAVELAAQLQAIQDFLTTGQMPSDFLQSFDVVRLVIEMVQSIEDRTAKEIASNIRIAADMTLAKADPANLMVKGAIAACDGIAEEIEEGRWRRLPISEEAPTSGA